jgi:hypothetical protein
MRVKSVFQEGWEGAISISPRIEESAGSRSGVKALTESIQDTSPRIHAFADSGPRNKKPVSDETCPPNLSVGSMLQSKI